MYTQNKTIIIVYFNIIKQKYILNNLSYFIVVFFSSIIAIYNHKYVMKSYILKRNIYTVNLAKI